MTKLTQTKTVWIYESPDKGKTIYKRPFGKLEPKVLIKKNGIDISNRLNWRKRNTNTN